MINWLQKRMALSGVKKTLRSMGYGDHYPDALLRAVVDHCYTSAKRWENIDSAAGGGLTAGGDPFMDMLEGQLAALVNALGLNAEIERQVVRTGLPPERLVSALSRSPAVAESIAFTPSQASTLGHILEDCGHRSFMRELAAVAKG